MSESIAEIHKRVLNHGATWKDFPVGTKVKIVCLCRDFYFFYGETGVVTQSSDKYLGIVVTFDEPRHFESTVGSPTGYVQYQFGFKPEDLVVIYTPKMQTVTKHLLDRLYRVIGD